MYTVDDRDQVIELRDVPQSSIGAPCPIVLSAEHSLLVAYFVQDTPSGWDGATARVVGVETAGEPAAIVRFARPYASVFGPPNDEAFSGHPLAHKGLHPYAAFEVKASSWIRALERMNAVHPYHQPQHFARYRHLVLAFHDTTFECVAEGYTWEVTVGPLNELVARAASALGE